MMQFCFYFGSADLHVGTVDDNINVILVKCRKFKKTFKMDAESEATDFLFFFVGKNSDYFFFADKS